MLAWHNKYLMTLFHTSYGSHSNVFVSTIAEYSIHINFQLTMIWSSVQLSRL